MVMDWRTARHLGAGSAESYDGTRREARLPEPPCVDSGGHAMRSTGSSDGIAGRSTRWRRGREIKLDDRVGESASKHLFHLRHIPVPSPICLLGISFAIVGSRRQASLQGTQIIR